MIHHSCCEQPIAERPTFKELHQMLLQTLSKYCDIPENGILAPNSAKINDNSNSQQEHPIYNYKINQSKL